MKLFLQNFDFLTNSFEKATTKSPDELNFTS